MKIYGTEWKREYQFLPTTQFYNIRSRDVRTKTTTDEISEISDWTRTDEIFKILDQFGLNLSGLITWLNPLAVELEIFLRMIYESRHVIHVTFDNVDTLLWHILPNWFNGDLVTGQW